MDDFVEMKHPNLKDLPPSRVHPSSVEVWKKRGWVLVGAEPKAEPKSEFKPPARPAPRPAEDKE